MEAPSKIYLHPDIGDEDFIRPWLKKPFNKNSVEYTRTDAFIEKACDAYCEVCGHYHHTVPYEICRHDCNYYDDFKELLKGE